MTKDMSEHRTYIQQRIEACDENSRAKLFLYHTVRMHDFQHERIIHIIVTALVALITVLMVITSVVTHELMFLLVDAILMPLLLAYLVHYRTLENGVQELYELTRRLGQ